MELIAFLVLNRSIGRSPNLSSLPKIPENDTISCSEWTIFRTARANFAASPQEERLARNMLYLKRVLIMKYAQFHALYDALKERVGSVKKLRTR